MPRLHRPHIGVEAKLRVALRCLGEIFIDEVVRQHRRGMGEFLKQTLGQLALVHDCSIKDLRLDHEPALALRRRKGEGRFTVYIPDACDPEFLVYRTKTDHDRKTRIRGDGAQFSDLALIRREKRWLQRKRKKTRRIQSASRWPTRGSSSGG